jgi:hypothetical protein
LDPSAAPSVDPSASPSSVPSLIPSGAPSFVPSTAPSFGPSFRPSLSPSSIPSIEPSFDPSDVPSSLPSLEPSSIPSGGPSDALSSEPSSVPSPSSSTNVANVDIKTAGNFVILSKSGISTVPNSDVTGNIGVSPIDSGSITGFSLTLDSSGDFATSDQVIGVVKASDYTGPTAPELTDAVSDMEAAYTDAAGRVTTPGASYTNLGGGEIGGKTLTTGVYTFNIAVHISTGNLTFSGTATDIFIIQSSLTVTQAAYMNVILEGGALAKNIFWSVADVYTVDTNAHMKGIILAATSVTFNTGSSLEGHILAQTAVTLQSATITQPTMSSSVPSLQPSSIPSGGPTDT